MPTKAKSTKKRIDWKKIFTPPIIICAILCVFCVVMVVICLLFPSTKEVSVTSSVENMKALDAITPKDQLVQEFTSDGDYTRFGLYYANFSNYIQGGELHIDIKNPSGEVNKFTYNIGGVIDNTFVYVDYPLSKDMVYTISIYITGTAQGITFFTTTANNQGAKLTENGQLQKSSIIMSFVNERTDYFAAWYYFLAFALVLCYAVLKVDKDLYVKKS